MDQSPHESASPSGLPSSDPASSGVHLVRTAENADEIDALAGLLGGRVGVPGLLADLDRRCPRTRAPGCAVDEALTWEPDDRRDRRWWPQGITTSADASETELVEGRRLVAVSWYAKRLPGDPEGGQGVRISVIDLGTRRYRHVLVVVPTMRDGALVLEPLRAHAGGIVWCGDHLHVAATGRGFLTCRMSDLMRVPDAAAGPPDTLGVDGARVASYGYRYVLPVRLAHRARTAEGVDKLRYSFLSLDRAADPPELVVGEYGGAKQTRRFGHFPVDPGTGLPAAGEDGATHPLRLADGGMVRTQGAVVVGGSYYLTASQGPLLPGTVYAGRPGAFRAHRLATPMGPEDLAWWPSTDLLWSVTEHPHRRWIYAMRRSRFAA